MLLGVNCLISVYESTDKLILRKNLRYENQGLLVVRQR